MYYQNAAAIEYFNVKAVLSILSDVEFRAMDKGLFEKYGIKQAPDNGDNGKKTKTSKKRQKQKSKDNFGTWLQVSKNKIMYTNLLFIQTFMLQHCTVCIQFNAHFEIDYSVCVVLC